MELINDLLAIREGRLAEEATAEFGKMIAERIANTKQIEDGLIAAFTDVHHTGGFEKERGAFNHRKRAIGSSIGDIDNLGTEMIRNSGQTAMQRLFNGDALGAVLMLAGASEAEYDASSQQGGEGGVEGEEPTMKPEGQFISVGKGGDGVYKVTFNLKFIKQHFGEEGSKLLDLLGIKLGTTKPRNMLQTDQDFVTIEDLEEHRVQMAFIVLLKQLKRKEEEYVFLILTGDRQEAEEGESDGEEDSFKMDDTPAEEAPAEAPVEDEEQQKA